jgi:hypothetical protein
VIEDWRKLPDKAGIERAQEQAEGLFHVAVEPEDSDESAAVRHP